jgi:hypothetical protein
VVCVNPTNEDVVGIGPCAARAGCQGCALLKPMLEEAEEMMIHMDNPLFCGG